MPVIVSAAPPSDESRVQIVNLGGVEFRLHHRWAPRLELYYIDLYELDGTPVFVGQLMSRDFSPTTNLQPANRPVGELIVSGLDVYQKADLGLNLITAFLAPDEVPTATARNLTVEVL